MLKMDFLQTEYNTIITNLLLPLHATRVGKYLLVILLEEKFDSKSINSVRKAVSKNRCC